VPDYFIVTWNKSNFGPDGKPRFAEIVGGPYPDFSEAQIIARDRRESSYREEAWQRERGSFNGPYEDTRFRAMTQAQIDYWVESGIDVR
jgi:hypothetical protein